MARKKYPNQAELPGLFDDFEVTLPSKEYPIHPDIARHAQEKKQEESLIETPLEKKKEAERLLFMSFGSGRVMIDCFSPVMSLATHNRILPGSVRHSSAIKRLLR